MRASRGVASAVWVLSALAGCADAEKSAPVEAKQASSAASREPTPVGAKQTGAAPTSDNGIGKRDPIGGVSSSMPELLPTPGLPATGERKTSVMQAFASDVGGKLDSAEVQSTIDGGADKLRACITTDSRVSVKVNVLTSGAVGDARVVSATPNDPKLKDCVIAQLRKLSFPKPAGNEAATFTMNLDLRKQAP